MNNSQYINPTALVLGGGGSTGNAWLIGAIAGLLEAGVDVTAADVVVGTSAGSTAAAQIASADPGELYEQALAVPPHVARPGRPSGGAPAVDYVALRMELINASSNPADLRRRRGESARADAASTDASAQQRWRQTVASRLPSQEWPDQRILITAVDADGGDPVTFDRDSGVELADAVAASCSSRFAYRIGERSYIDGAFRTNAENADLAAGYDRVLVLSPFGGRALTPGEWRLDLAAQVADLRAAGSLVEQLSPPEDARHLFGNNAMDLSLRPEAARLGREQGLALAKGLREWWSASYSSSAISI